MPQYNLSMVANQSGLVPIMQQVNSELMFNWFGIMILIAIAIILFMAFLKNTDDTKKSMAAAAFITFVSSLFLRGMDLVPDLAIFVTLIAVSIAAAWLFFTG